MYFRLDMVFGGIGVPYCGQRVARRMESTSHCCIIVIVSNCRLLGVLVVCSCRQL
jgi:hypothetical protein